MVVSALITYSQKWLKSSSLIYFVFETDYSIFYNFWYGKHRHKKMRGYILIIENLWWEGWKNGIIEKILFIGVVSNLKKGCGS